MISKGCPLAVVVVAMLVCRAGRARSEDLTDQELERMFYAKGQLVILGSGHDYDALLRQAKKIGLKAGVKVDLMGRTFDAKKGWESADEGDGVGGYILRNARDGGETSYISIELSDAYPGLQMGYMIIVGGVYLNGKEAAASLAKFKKVVPGAYAPQAAIYMGCRH